MNASKYNAMLPVNIACAIKARGMKNSAVADRAGFSVQQLSDMLNGRKIIKPCDILAIADVLGISVGDLFVDTYGNWSGCSGEIDVPPQAGRDTA